MKKKTQAVMTLLRHIEHRWIDHNSNDITLSKPLPAWQQIISDIETLLNIIEASFSSEDFLEKEYQNGWDDGFDEAMREVAQKNKIIRK